MRIEFLILNLSLLENRKQNTQLCHAHNSPSLSLSLFARGRAEEQLLAQKQPSRGDAQPADPPLCSLSLTTGARLGRFPPLFDDVGRWKKRTACRFLASDPVEALRGRPSIARNLLLPLVRHYSALVAINTKAVMVDAPSSLPRRHIPPLPL